MSLVLGLEHSCPWPREGLSSEGLSLALASDFFCVLGLGPVSSTPPLIFMVINFEKSIFLCVFYVCHIKVSVLVSINSISYINERKMWVFADLDLFMSLPCSNVLQFFLQKFLLFLVRKRGSFLLKIQEPFRNNASNIVAYC